MSRFSIFFLTCLTILLTASIVTAQDSALTGWQTSLIADVTATQTAYSDSWTGGEAGSFSWVSNVNGTASKQLSPKFNLKSSLKMSYGQTLTQDKDTKKWSEPTKSTDLIDWENVGRFTLHKYVDPYVAFRIETQFVDASVDAKNRYLSPLKLTESGGVARELYKKEEDQIITRFGLALRQIITKEIVDSITFATENVTTTDGGLESVTDVKLSLHERLGYVSKLTLYKALFFSEKDAVAGTEAEDYWKAVDVNWENIINASITKIITVNFYTQFLYDKEVSKQGRVKQTMGLGFVFKLM
jgi:hypothetical protein